MRGLIENRHLIVPMMQGLWWLWLSFAVLVVPVWYYER